MTGLYLPGAVWRPIPYRAAAGKFTSPPLGYIPHVQQGNGSPFGYFSRLISPSRKFSTAWVAKDGHSEQYQSLNMKPWAQGTGNGQYHAFETEGYVGEKLTAAQINTLARWHNFLGTPDVLANAPGQRGVGTHAMGGAAWGGHTCPGLMRAAQRAAIIARAIAMRRLGDDTGRDYTRTLIITGVLDRATIGRLHTWVGLPYAVTTDRAMWRAIQHKVGGYNIVGTPNATMWRAIQRLTGAGVDGVAGPDTIRHWQAYLNAH